MKEDKGMNQTRCMSSKDVARSLQSHFFFSFQISPVGTRPPSPTPSCMATLALKWGMSCSTFAPRGTSWATRRRRSRYSATPAGSGTGRFRPVSKVSSPSTWSTPLGGHSLPSAQPRGFQASTSVSWARAVPVKILVTEALMS